MTLHWWMHWFWITVVTPVLLTVLFVVPSSHTAPYSSPLPEFSADATLTPLEFHSETEHPRFHHDSTLYVALLHGGASPTTFADEDDTPSPSAMFPFHVSDPIPMHEMDDSYHINVQLTASHIPPLEHDPHEEENHTTLDVQHDNPIDEEILSSGETDHDEGNTKMMVRDIGLSSRSGKAIGRDYVSSTSLPDVITTASQISNHNPFIEKDNTETSASSGEKVLKVPDTPSPPVSNEDEKEEEKDESPLLKESSVVPADKQQTVVEPQTEAPHELRESVSSTATSDVPVKSHSETNMTPVTKTEQEQEISSAPIPPWVPSFSSAEESAEEAEAEENLRPELNLSDEQASAEANSEAVTRGRMTADDGLEASSIVGIVLGLVGLVSIVGGAVGFVLYRRRFLNKPQTLNDKCSNADSSGYIDDTLRVSATRMNRGANSTSGSQQTSSGKSKANKRQSKATENIPCPYNKDNSEEMYSLDNDSFLNSLEAMTIQNYWTDSVKHTKL